MAAVYTHIPLHRLGMTTEEVEEWADKLNAELIDTTFNPAVITNDGELAIDAQLGDLLRLANALAQRDMELDLIRLGSDAG